MRGGLCIQAAAPRMPAPPPVPRRRSGPPTEPHHRSKPGATAAQPEAEKARAYQRAFDDLVRQNVMSKYLFINVLGLRARVPMQVPARKSSWLTEAEHEEHDSWVVGTHPGLRVAPRSTQVILPQRMLHLCPRWQCGDTCLAPVVGRPPAPNSRTSTSVSVGSQKRASAPSSAASASSRCGHSPSERSRACPILPPDKWQ